MMTGCFECEQSRCLMIIGGQYSNCSGRYLEVIPASLNYLISHFKNLPDNQLHKDLRS